MLLYVREGAGVVRPEVGFQLLDEGGLRRD